MIRKWIIFLALILPILGFIAAYITEPEYAYTPPSNKVLSNAKIKAFQTDNNQRFDPALLAIGRKAFYEETFGNEVFLTDIMGVVNGPLTIPNIAKAILKLGGDGTTNLRVELAETVTLGNKTFKKGTEIDTGLDVPKGAYMPLGMPIKYSEGKMKVGLSCIACHATVDRDTKMVIEGAPNSDLNAGLLIALATNSTAYFTHAEISAITDYMKDLDRTVTTTDGKTSSLPDPVEIEKAVDAIFVNWPRGNFDSTIDLKSNPAQIPDSFTLGDHPYGWSGFAAAGPFKGLSAFSNNVHAQNSDSLSQADASPALFGIDKEVYLGTILQNAANAKYRFNPKQGKKPSEFFSSVDPTPGVPGVNELIKSPTFPKVSLVAPDGFFVSSPGSNVWEQNNGMAAWQNTLVPPEPRVKIDPKTRQLGQTVFQRAGCITCHAGDAFTNNRIIPAKVIGTDPSRAKSFKKTEKIFGDSKIYSFDTPVPLPEGAEILDVPTDHLDPDQIKLAYAHGNSSGGYKVPSLIGLFWTAPYLHDGGVAVGPNAKAELGMSGTWISGIQPNPANSLRALVDKNLREKVIAANKSLEDLQQLHVQGTGHEYWVDSSTGFTQKEQNALVQYLLSLDPITKENGK
jgi:hypothetical protein